MSKQFGFGFLYKLGALFIMTLLGAPIALAGNDHYSGHGIAFDYRDKYQLTETQTKHGWKIDLKSGPNSVVLNVYPNPLLNGFSDVVIDGVQKSFAKQGRTVTEAKTENIQLPVKLNGSSERVMIPAVRYSHVINVEEGKLKLAISQTMLFFSQGDQGYFINATRTNAPERDFAKLISSLSVDE